MQGLRLQAQPRGRCRAKGWGDEGRFVRRSQGELSMATRNNIRQFIVLKAINDLREHYAGGDLGMIRGILHSYLRQRGYEPAERDFEVTILPSKKWTLEIADKDSNGELRRERLQPVPTLDIGLTFYSQEALDNVRKAINEDQAKELFVGIGADLPFQATDCWCPGEATDPIYGDRSDADKLINAKVLEREGLKGRNVNVVVIDRGLDLNHIKVAGRWQFAMANRTPVPTPDNHAMMVARHIQKTAPHAAIFDCALLPEHISDIEQFMIVAHSAYVQMLADIASWKQNHSESTQWVFVNAWAIYNRRSEYPPGDYTNNADHPFNSIVREAAAADQIDIVFAAGNCGLFCPKMNCGRNDRGPGRSIFGANSHTNVLTTGAVRTDRMWLGYSSQGPGQSNLDTQKPDLCVPSQYRETHDAHLVNTGTSASCALAAGVIAALRSRAGWDSTTISPDRLRNYLIKNSTNYPQWDGKLGHGILDVEAAFNELEHDFP